MRRSQEQRRMAFMIPSSMAEQLNSIAWKNRRSMTAEVVIALEQHLAIEATKKASGLSPNRPDASHAE